MTYNHSNFIEDALNGFCSQQTNFPYVCIIFDDASTDGEQKVIHNYLQDHFDLDDKSIVKKEKTDDFVMTFARHKTNINCYFAVYLLKYNHYSIKKSKTPYMSEFTKSIDYIALCEGDDYWTDPLKLQIQYDFLKHNPEYSFCCHRYHIYEQNKNRYLKEYAFNYYKEGEDLEISEDLMLKIWVTQTMSTMIPEKLWKSVIIKKKPYVYSRDVHTYYFLLKEGKGVSLNRNMGVYRWHDSGVAIGQTFDSKYKIGYELYRELYLSNIDDTLLIRKIFFNGYYYILCGKWSMYLLQVFKYLWRIEKSRRKRLYLLLACIIPSALAKKIICKRRNNRNEHRLIS